MIIKDKFTLLTDVPNILNLSSQEIKKYSVEKGTKNLFTVLDLNEDSLKQHYTKKSVYNFINDSEKKKRIVVLNMPEYNRIHISYNKPSDQIVFNISPWDVDNIYTNNIDFKNIYAQMVYGISFFKLASGRFKVKPIYFSPISNYFLSLFVSIFGKEYGLLGIYTYNITKLNFLISCYVLSSFFGISGKKSYSLAGTSSAFSYKDIEKDLDNYNFSKIEDFIKSLSELQVFPGMNKYSFTGKIVRMFGISFIPALEDLSRFLSIMACVDIKGSNVVLTHISKYDNSSFNRIIEISKLIFR